MNEHTPHTTSTEQILSRIEEEGITPRPKWQFLARNWTVWILGGLSMAIGAAAVAVAIFEMRHADWEIYEATHPSLLSFIMEMLPYLWFVVLAIFAVSAYLLVRHTKYGYRYSYPVLIIGPVCTSIACGIFLYSLGLDETIESYVESTLPFHTSSYERERSLWSAPETGYVAGMVSGLVTERKTFMMQAIDGNEYMVDAGGFFSRDLETLELGDLVRVVGLPTTTPNVIDGCILLLRNNDRVVRANTTVKSEAISPHTAREKDERKIMIARSMGCRTIPPFLRLEYRATAGRY